MWVNPFGSIEPLPLYRADAATQRETLLCFRLLAMECSCISHSATCLYRHWHGDTGEDIRR